MAKQIRLLATYPNPGGGYFSPGAIITVEDAVATQLIANQNATLDLTGGTPAFQQAPISGVPAATNAPSPQTVSAGQTATVLIPAGTALSMQATPNILGTRQVLNPDGSVVSTTSLSSGLDSTGVFLRDTRVKFSVIFGTIDLAPEVTGGGVELDTLLAGEILSKNWQASEAGATESGGTVLPGRTDQLLGSIGSPADFLKRINAVVSSSTDSRVVRKEGNPLPKKSLTTHASTASTTTVLNTAVNSEAVTADQYKDHMVRVGTGPYRKILTHSAFAAAAVNTYTLDVPLAAAPAVSQPIIIEFPELVVEVLPVGAAVGPHALPVDRFSRGDGWRLSTGTTVLCDPSGDFDNV